MDLARALKAAREASPEEGVSGRQARGLLRIVGTILLVVGLLVVGLELLFVLAIALAGPD